MLRGPSKAAPSASVAAVEANGFTVGDTDEAAAPTVSLQREFSFHWTAVNPTAEPNKEGAHLAAAATGSLHARDSASAGTFSLQRVPVGSKHGVEGAAMHNSDTGDLLVLALAAAETQTQWVARRTRDNAALSFWQQYQWWIMGLIFVANLGLRSWARSGRGAADPGAAAPGPTMQEARTARRGKNKTS
jgi:hypothetical protein